MWYLKNCVVITVLFSTLSSVVTSDSAEDNCKDNYMDMNNDPIINIEDFCEHTKCIVRCCANGRSFNKDQCIKSRRPKILAETIDATPIYSWDGYLLRNSSMNLKKDFNFVYNTKWDIKHNCTDEVQGYFTEINIMEDATLKYRSDKDDSYNTKDRLDYCIDYRIKQINKKYKFGLVLRFLKEPKVEYRFIAYGMLVSCFFIFLTLFVYCALPKLQNLVGMILMSYLISLFFYWLLKSIYLLDVAMDEKDCRIYSAFVYFFMFSTFTWLFIISFDIWRTFRKEMYNNKSIQKPRCEIISKFKRYCLCGYGFPLLLTIGASLVNCFTDWPDQYKPPFDKCFVEQSKSARNYVTIPIGIMIGLNFIFYILTGYNLFMYNSRGRALRSPESRSTKSKNNQFSIYTKLAVSMGVNWLFEAFPNTLSTWLYYIINMLIVSIGIAIFVIFVCKKKVLLDLCLRFNIKHKFVELYLKKAPNSELSSTRMSQLSALQRSRAEANCTT